MNTDKERIKLAKEWNNNIIQLSKLVRRIYKFGKKEGMMLAKTRR
jgi:hypothetical protein